MNKLVLTACKQYCLAAGATLGNIAYTQNVVSNLIKNYIRDNEKQIKIRIIPSSNAST